MDKDCLIWERLETAKLRLTSEDNGVFQTDQNPIRSQGFTKQNRTAWLKMMAMFKKQKLGSKKSKEDPNQGNSKRRSARTALIKRLMPDDEWKGAIESEAVSSTVLLSPILQSLFFSQLFFLILLWLLVWCIFFCIP